MHHDVTVAMPTRHSFAMMMRRARCAGGDIWNPGLDPLFRFRSLLVIIVPSWIDCFGLIRLSLHNRSGAVKPP